MRAGERTLPVESLAVVAGRLSADLAALPPAARHLETPTPVTVCRSERLAALTREVAAGHRPALGAAPTGDPA